MPQLVLVCLASVEIYFSASNAKYVCTVDDLLDEFHLLIGGRGNRVDLGANFVEGFTGSHQEWQVLCSPHKVCIEQAREFVL